MSEYEKNNQNTTDPLEERLDPTEDNPTNLRDDGSMHPTHVEKETPPGERPDSHEGTTSGEVDPRMQEAAAAFKNEHDQEDASRQSFDRPTPDRE
ncbi:hypothetical protein [Saccharibacillus sacchari]|uniref:Uncharacterized protein n=1 Tax=Saccharibacillus sacchari TaxID=456493 RepID=A0ACC6PIJ0_9BACL